MEYVCNLSLKIASGVWHPLMIGTAVLQIHNCSSEHDARPVQCQLERRKVSPLFYYPFSPLLACPTGSAAERMPEWRRRHIIGRVVIFIVWQNKVNEGPGGGGPNEEVDEGADKVGGCA